eukprot:4950505-Alexandrium_andersonii.AAC.1
MCIRDSGQGWQSTGRPDHLPRRVPRRALRRRVPDLRRSGCRPGGARLQLAAAAGLAPNQDLRVAVLADVEVARVERADAPGARSAWGGGLRAPRPRSEAT